MNVNSTEPDEPSAESLAEIPEIDLKDPRYRVLGRGPAARREHALRQVSIDPDLWEHFRSEKAVNDALRSLVERDPLGRR